MNEDHEFSKDDAYTRQALRQILPAQRCSLDGRPPHDPVWLPCGHIYCRLCIEDIIVTARLIGRTPICKTCGQEYGGPYTRLPGAQIPPLDDIRARHGLRTGTTTEFVHGGAWAQVHPGTLGEDVKNLLEFTEVAGLPWVPPSETVGKLLTRYTRRQLADLGTEETVSVPKKSKQLLRSLVERDRDRMPPPESRPDDDSFGVFEFNLSPGLGIDILGQDHSDMPFGFSMSGEDMSHPMLPSISFAPKGQLQQQTPRTLKRDISVLANKRFCFKGILPNCQAMEDAVRAYGGNVTGGGYKHTTYGVVGPGWKITDSWVKNGVQILSEEEFWALLERKRQETARAKQLKSS
jgi:hypothetical protein